MSRPPLSTSLPPLAPTLPKYPSTLKLGSRQILTGTTSQSCSWKPFTSSSRQDGVQFHHWVKSHVEYTDYPYARFNVSLDKLSIPDDDITDCNNTNNSNSNSNNWSRHDTETLLNLCHKYDLRWPILIDRWRTLHPTDPRQIQDLQYEYYRIANMVKSPQHHGSPPMLDLRIERERRDRLDRLWNMSKVEETEGHRLHQEMRGVELQIRKRMKLGGELESSRFDPAFVAAAPMPGEGTPYLQSGRLVAPAPDAARGLNKGTLKQMELMLRELGVPEEVIATKKCCDLYDGVRKEALRLLVLRKIVLRKEAEVVSRRNKLNLGRMRVGVGEQEVVVEKKVAKVEKLEAGVGVGVVIEASKIKCGGKSLSVGKKAPATVNRKKKRHDAVVSTPSAPTVSSGVVFPMVAPQPLVVDGNGKKRGRPPSAKSPVKPTGASLPDASVTVSMGKMSGKKRPKKN